MIEIINSNEGLISLISLTVSIIIAVIGFAINKNLLEIIQSQGIGKNAKGLQSGRDVNDSSVTKNDAVGGDYSAVSVGGSAHNSNHKE